MKIKVIMNNENILSSRDLNIISKRRKIFKKLTSKDHYLLKELISTKDEIIFINDKKEEEKIYSDIKIVFNWYQNNLFRIYKEWEKLSNNDKIFYVYWDKVSINYLLFFLTRSHLALFIGLYKKWQTIKFVRYTDILNIPIPKPTNNWIINKYALTKVIEELLLAEREKMYFAINVLSGSIVEFILEDIVKRELLEKWLIKDEIKEKFKMMEWLIELCKIYNLIDNENIERIIREIQQRRNMIHPKVLETWIWDIENHSIKCMSNLEEIILYYWL